MGFGTLLRHFKRTDSTKVTPQVTVRWRIDMRTSDATILVPSMRGYWTFSLRSRSTLPQLDPKVSNLYLRVSIEALLDSHPPTPELKIDSFAWVFHGSRGSGQSQYEQLLRANPTLVSMISSKEYLGEPSTLPNLSILPHSE